MRFDGVDGEGGAGGSLADSILLLEFWWMIVTIRQKEAAA